jgi:hypothetical protein
MAKKNNAYKPVTVKEHPVQSIKEAGLFNLTLKDGTRAVFIANSGFPHFDEGLLSQQLKHIADVKPGVLFLLGHMGDSGAFQATIEDEKNFLHTYADSEPVIAARKHKYFEERVMSLGKSFGDFIKGFADASPDATIVWIPAWVNLGLPNELDILDWIHQKKRLLDSWTSNHTDSPDQPSQPFVTLPETLEGLLGLENEPRIKILPFGAAVLINEKLLVLGGSFRRRHAGDSPWIEWEQRGYSIVRAVDGKASSGWATNIQSTIPEPIYNCIQVHELGYGWEAKEYGHLGDYHRRCQAILSGSFFFGTFFGDISPFMPGNDGRRTLYVQGRAYTEDTPGGQPNGGELTLYDASQAAASSSTTENTGG